MLIFRNTLSLKNKQTKITPLKIFDWHFILSTQIKIISEPSNLENSILVRDMETESSRGHTSWEKACFKNQKQSINMKMKLLQYELWMITYSSMVKQNRWALVLKDSKERELCSTVCGTVKNYKNTGKVEKEWRCLTEQNCVYSAYTQRTLLLVQAVNFNQFGLLQEEEALSLKKNGYAFKKCIAEGDGILYYIEFHGHQGMK